MNVRRVYVLPSHMVEDIRRVAAAEGHKSETAAARVLIEEALTKWEKANR